VCTGGSFPPIKRPELEINNSPPSGAQDKNKWSYTSTPLIYLHSADKEKLYFDDDITAKMLTIII
jgi:hypothetical protein